MKLNSIDYYHLYFFSIVTGSDVTKMIMEKVVVDNKATIVNVVRGKVLDGATRAVKRISFDPRSPISVKFMDDVGTTEGAVDQGGPRREFFSLVLRELNNGPMFSGPSGNKFIIPNHTGMYFLSVS